MDKVDKFNIASRAKSLRLYKSDVALKFSKAMSDLEDVRCNWQTMYLSFIYS